MVRVESAPADRINAIMADTAPSSPSTSPATIYRVVALAEALTWALLLSGMALKYSGTTEALMPGAGIVHGFVFLAFCVVTVLIWVNNHWSFGRGVLGLAFAIIPFATIPFERSVENAGLLQGAWRFQNSSGDTPRTLPEKILALVVQKPLLSAVLLLTGIIVVFLVLLSLGSPLEWFRG